ncbi:MAG: phosphate ABC transporter ATP-binding protein PstB [Elusimicrobiota bacterium]
MKTEEKKNIAVEIRNLRAGYGSGDTLKGINLPIYDKKITAIIGPSGCGKSTLIRCINRMHEIHPTASTSGEIIIENKNIFDLDPVLLRQQVGMVFQRPNPFPTMTIFQNVAAGLVLKGVKDKNKLSEVVELSLKRAAIWDEVKDKLQQNALNLSGGQQQRLCIARALAVSPKVLLLDEPCSALDPIATARIEELLLELKQNLTIAIVTHNMQQAARSSDYTAFMLLGDLIEFGVTDTIFTNPVDQRTQDYVTGRFG